MGDIPAPGGNFFGCAVLINFVGWFHDKIGVWFVEVLLERLEAIHLPPGFTQLLSGLHFLEVSTATEAAASTSTAATPRTTAGSISEITRK